MLDLQQGGCCELTVMIQAADHLHLGWVAIILSENHLFLTNVTPRSHSGRAFPGSSDMDFCGQTIAKAAIVSSKSFPRVKSERLVVWVD